MRISASNWACARCTCTCDIHSELQASHVWWLCFHWPPGGALLCQKQESAGPRWHSVVHLEGLWLLLTEEGEHDDSPTDIQATPVSMTTTAHREPSLLWCDRAWQHVSALCENNYQPRLYTVQAGVRSPFTQKQNVYLTMYIWSRTDTHITQMNVFKSRLLLAFDVWILAWTARLWSIMTMLHKNRTGNYTDMENLTRKFS